MKGKLCFRAGWILAHELAICVQGSLLIAAAVVGISNIKVDRGLGGAFGNDGAQFFCGGAIVPPVVGGQSFLQIRCALA